ncbi:hypothetical protein G6F42_028458 [Rhizopus arrhizus]|nr:hypothetical protein G6F42_028458 [Rhizopus arrhizus]
MSPSLSPKRENFDTGNSFFNDSKQLSSEKTDTADESTPRNESDLWISSSPKIGSKETADNVSPAVSSGNNDETVNPCKLMMSGSPSTADQDRNAGKNYFNATTLTIG